MRRYNDLMCKTCLSTSLVACLCLWAMPWLMYSLLLVSSGTCIFLLAYFMAKKGE